jgi:hypothetical protein
MKCIGLWHFGQVGGGEFLAMGTLALDQAGALPNSLSPITAGWAVIVHIAPPGLKIASQFQQTALLRFAFQTGNEAFAGPKLDCAALGK